MFYEQVEKKLEIRNYPKRESTLVQSLKDWQLEWRRLRLVTWKLLILGLGCSGNWGRAETWGRPMGPGVNEPMWAEVNPHTLGFKYYYRLKTVTSTFSALTFFLQHSCYSYTIPCNSPNRYLILNMSKTELSLNLKPVFPPVFTISNGDTTIQSGTQC